MDNANTAEYYKMRVPVHKKPDNKIQGDFEAITLSLAPARPKGKRGPAVVTEKKKKGIYV